MLHIISTPIGSIEECSLQAAKVLVASDIILAEDTRSFQHLYKSVQKLYNLESNPNQKIWSYYKEVEFQKLPEVIGLLEKGKYISLVSEAGTPLISDPGSLLMQMVSKKGLSYSAIPGSTAFVNAAVLSGKPFSQLFFLGFFPKKPSEKNKLIVKIQNLLELFPDSLTTLYESPDRTKATVTTLVQSIPKITCTIVREMNKTHEEVIHITSENIEELGDLRGEITLCISRK
ncbi:MAG: SAM-dependent methyltransferase [Candidatus Roizmanbacteria bacterium]